MSYFSNFPFSKIGLFAIPLAFFVGIINFYSPPSEKAPAPYSSVILAIEFVNTPEDVIAVLEPLSSSELRALDKLNYADFGFMVCYTLFLFSFLKKLIDVTGNDRMKILLVIPVLILLGDFFENLQLLKLTSLFDSGNEEIQISQVILCLQFFTWLKWSLLACIFALFSKLLWKYKGMYPKLIGLFLLLPFLLLLLSIFGNTAWLDRFASSIFLVFFLLLIFCFSYKLKFEN